MTRETKTPWVVPRGPLSEDLPSTMGLLVDQVASDNRIGQVIAGKYRLKRILGRGAHGTVFRADHLDLGQDVALKLLNQEVAHDEQAQKRFLREVHLTTSFVHKYAVQLRDFGRDHDLDLLYFTMDLIEGQTLAEVQARERQLSELRVVSLATQTLEALAEAHHVGIVHRDLKPTNLLLTRGVTGAEEVRVLDFGVAKAASRVLAGTELTQLTRIGARVGTLAYMSPEQAMGEDVDARSDLYTVGTVIYQALTGKRPCFPTDSVENPVQAFLFNLTTQPPIPLRDLAPHVSPGVAEAVGRALAKKPSERFSDALEFRKALLKVAKRLVGQRRRRSGSGTNRPLSSKRRSGSREGKGLKRTKRLAVSSSTHAALPRGRRRSYDLPDGVIHGPGKGEFINQSDGSSLVWIPPGVFQRGRAGTLPAKWRKLPTGERLGREGPVHEVRLTRGMFLGKLPVTWRQFRRFCLETGRPVPTSVNFRGVVDFDITDSHPAVNVSWKEAMAYCRWAKGRLPSEAEWEFAARGDDDRHFPWGEETPSPKLVNWEGHPLYGGRATSPVGSFPRGHSPYGCLDMSGNCWEWVYDAYADYEAGSLVDPRVKSKKSGRPRVIRGGSWLSPAAHCRATARGALPPDAHTNWLGFRLCRVVTPAASS
jgi:eukaryotic-like serine/threonine-protein kinase